MSRVPPRDCIGAARDDLNVAWGNQADYRLMVLKMLSALDWLRRALEQMPFDSAEPPERGGAPKQEAVARNALDRKR